MGWTPCCATSLLRCTTQLATPFLTAATHRWTTTAEFKTTGSSSAARKHFRSSSHFRRRYMSSVIPDSLKCSLVFADTHNPITETQYTEMYRVVKRICASFSPTPMRLPTCYVARMRWNTPRRRRRGGVSVLSVRRSRGADVKLSVFVVRTVWIANSYGDRGLRRQLRCP